MGIAACAAEECSAASVADAAHNIMGSRKHAINANNYVLIAPPTFWRSGVK